VVVHLVNGTWRQEVVVYTAVCGVSDPAAGYWTINRDVATCPTCLKGK
jgi:hypothetical protein